MRPARTLSCFCGLFLAVTTGLSGDPKPATGALAPKDELATFRVAKGFRVELVAAEPDVVDPVAIAFDEDGRLFVAEMRGYPNDGVGEGTITSGKIKMLTDPDAKGVYRKSVTFADGLRFPTSVMPWKGGLLVAVAPDLIYLKDNDGDGKADEKRVLYTGFGVYNIQQLLNGLQWGLDNWVYACNGNNPSTVHSPEKKEMPALTLRGRGIRFHPDVPGSLEPTSGGGQFGLAADDWQRWFTATNSQHLRQIVLPDQYLRRNPYLPVAAVTLDIPDGVAGHGAVCQVHRISPFEGWRVERTTMRKDSPDSKRFPATELVPGGYITSACSPVVYTADLFPEAFRNNTFVCEPANNLIHRDILEPKGAVFSAKRGDATSEFLASTDIWFRPVNLTVGPDGALYVVDFYREVIETPLSLPPEMKKKLPLHSQGRGRIWRVVPESGAPFKKPELGKAPAAELVKLLEHPNPWWRLTAQRLLVERQDKSVVEPLKELALKSQSPQGRVHARWTLDGLHQLTTSLIYDALHDPAPEAREQALRQAEPHLAGSEAMRAAAIKLANDASPRVRFQAAFTLGATDAPEAAAALAKLLRRDAADPWTQTAVLSSAVQHAPGLLETFAADRGFLQNMTPVQALVLMRLASMIGAKGDNAEMARALHLLDADKHGIAAWQVAILEGLGQGQQLGGRSLRKLWEEPPAALKESVERAQPFFKRAAETAHDGKRPLTERVAAARLLGYAPFRTGADALKDLLAPSNPSELQRAAVRSLSLQEHPQVAELLLSQWNSQGPEVRSDVLEAIFARADRLAHLLTAIEQKKVSASQLPPARVEQLRAHKDPELRKRAAVLLAGRATPARQKVIDEYKSALDLTADAAKGKMVFQKVCSTCHRLENEGKEVGPDLLSALRTKTPDALLIDILDPSREVDPRYINYIVSTKDGRVVTGIVAVEGPSSITLRRANREEEDVLRSQIDEIQATAKSLMPDELEKQLSKQDVADVIAYLRKVAAPK